MKILVAEDDPDSRRLLVLVLQKAGHDVVATADGASAFREWCTGEYRLVITDWMMPGGSGVELTRKIRAGSADFYTFIILLTSLSAKPQVVMGLEAGADDYITKPFSPGELIQRVGAAQRILQHEERLHDSRREAEFLANHDALTGLLSRRAIEDQSKIELSRCNRTRTPLSFILVDLDHFKMINDQHGHQIGDLALQRTASVLAESVRVYDSVGRWGGEEFLVILPGAGAEQAQIVAERIRADMREHALELESGLFLNLRASLGIASSTGQLGDSYQLRDGSLLEAMLKAADDAMYQAKSQGRDQICLGEIF